MNRRLYDLVRGKSVPEEASKSAALHPSLRCEIVHPGKRTSQPRHCFSARKTNMYNLGTE